MRIFRRLIDLAIFAVPLVVLIGCAYVWVDGKKRNIASLIQARGEIIRSVRSYQKEAYDMEVAAAPSGGIDQLIWSGAKGSDFQAAILDRFRECDVAPDRFALATAKRGGIDRWELQLELATSLRTFSNCLERLNGVRPYVGVKRLILRPAPSSQQLPGQTKVSVTMLVWGAKGLPDE